MSTSEPSDELSRTLRDLRAAAAMSSTAAAQAAGIGQAALSRYENGRFVPTADRLAALLDVYRAPDAVRSRMTGIVGNLRAENRRVVVHRKNAPAFQRRIRDIEAASTHVTTFQPTMIPGILQTPAYMRVLTSSVDETIADGLIAARTERQQLLGTTGHRFTLILSAGALLWCAGSPETMAAQIDHIIDATHLAGTRIGIIPARRPMTTFPLHGFDLYDQRAVIVGTLANTAILTDPDDVRLHVDLLAKLTAAADFDDAARRTLTDLRDSYATP